MKTSVSIIVAASLGQASATFFHNAPPFTCPGNSNNHCLDEYRTGLNWQDLSPGNFDKYKGFLWKGFQAVDKFSKRSEIGPRTFQDKCIAGKAQKSRDDSPKMSCDRQAGNEKTSIKEFQIEVAFDCDLEFHFGMPDGTTCKQRHHCQHSGTTVPNSQCGGATDVTIVYPHQPELPHEGCDFAIPSIVFDCDNNTPTSTRPAVPPAQSTSTSPAQQTTSAASPTTFSSAVESSTPVSVPGNTYSASVPATSSSSGPQGSSSVTVPGAPATTSSSAGVATPSVSVPVNTYPVGVPPVSDSVSVPAATVSPSGSVPGVSTASENSPVTGSSSSSAPVATNTPIGTLSATASAPAGTSPVPAPPVETLPCPGVVPSCLNTWMFIVNCVDNTDSSCYCPDEKFVKNVFDCMYAHGETDDVVQQAVEYFQGICAPFVPQNPAIGTGAGTITSILTVTAPVQPPSATYTTIEIIATSVVPCTDAQGSEIPSSSSTVTYSTTVSVPEVHFTTITEGPAGSTQVGVVPGAPVYPTAAPPAGTTPLPTAPATPTAGGGGGGFGPYPTIPVGGGGGGATTLTTAKPPQQPPTGGVIVPTAPVTTIPVAGAARLGASVAAGALAIVALVL